MIGTWFFLGWPKVHLSILTVIYIFIQDKDFDGISEDSEISEPECSGMAHNRMFE